MKVCVDVPTGLSRAMWRTAEALKRYAPPWVEFVCEADAQLVFLHTIGYDAVDYSFKLQAQNKHYAVLQYCLRTTQRPNTREWVTFWALSRGVFSYYDLNALAREDGITRDIPKFVRVPLGVDSNVFYPRPMLHHPYLAFTSGYVAQSECLEEVADAAARVNGLVFHLGPAGTVNRDNNFSALDISDDELAQKYSASRYVTGLRRTEGFELPCAEGLLSGCRPILFDRSHYRDWFGDFAEYVPEGGPATVTNALEEIFRRPYRAVCEPEIARAREIFSWEKFANAVWRQTGA